MIESASQSRTNGAIKFAPGFPARDKGARSLQWPPGRTVARPRLAPGMAALILLLIVTARAEVVTLTLVNGDRLSGRLIERGASHVTLLTAWNQRLEIPVSQLQPVVPAAAPRLPMEPLPMTPVTVPGAAAEKPAPEPVPAVPAPAPPAPSTPAAAPAAAKPAPQRAAAGKWSNDLQLGADLQYSATDRQVYHVRWKNAYRNPRMGNQLDYSFSYGFTDGAISANRMDGAMKTDFRVSGRWYAYSLGAAGYNEIRSIDLRYSWGPGAGYHLLRDFSVFDAADRLAVALELGGEVEHKRFRNGQREDDYYYRLAQNADWKLNSKLKLNETFEVFPQIDELDKFRYRFEAGAAYSLLKNLSLNLTLLAESDPKVNNVVQPDSLQIRSTLGLKF